MEVVVTRKSNMALYFPEAGSLNGSNADRCSDVAGPSSSGMGDLFELSDRSCIRSIEWSLQAFEIMQAQFFFKCDK